MLLLLLITPQITHLMLAVDGFGVVMLLLLLITPQLTHLMLVVDGFGGGDATGAADNTTDHSLDAFPSTQEFRARLCPSVKNARNWEILRT